MKLSKLNKSKIQTSLKLVTAQHAMEKKMLHITLHDEVKKSVIRSKTKVKDILEKIRRQNGDGQGT